MFIVYVIQSVTTGKIYIGQTQNFKNRIARHNGLLSSKKNCYTSINKGEWKLVYKEEFGTRKEAVKREKELKSYRGREFIKHKILGR